MKLHIISDLHLSHGPFKMPSTDADVVVMAGDIDVGELGIQWIFKHITKPVVYVPGNHEYYGYTFPDLLFRLKELAKGTNVHVLNNEYIDIGEVRIFGTTLWTDYNLYHNVPVAMLTAIASMNDFQYICVSDEEERRGKRIIRPDDMLKLFNVAESHLKKLVKKKDKKTVVVTHHAPSLKSLNPCYGNSALNASFVSDMEKLIKSSCFPLWVHGHTHDAYDYTISNTRVVCNPRGYANWERTDYNPELVVEV